jgi:hypothetical protein
MRDDELRRTRGIKILDRETVQVSVGKIPHPAAAIVGLSASRVPNHAPLVVTSLMSEQWAKFHRFQKTFRMIAFLKERDCQHGPGRAASRW